MFHFFEARGDALADDASVLTCEHHDGAEDAFFAIPCGCAGAVFFAEGDFGEVADAERGDACGEFHGELGDFVGRGDPADGADGDLFTVLGDDAAAGVVGVGADDVGEFADG